MTRPAVTALLPIKNGQSWIPRIAANLRRCLEDEDQLVIIDDHSSDDSWSVLSKLHFDFEYVLYSNPGEGLVSALNFGIEIAKHEWIARFDVDDSYPENRLEMQFSHFTESTVAIFGDYLIVDSFSNNLGLIPSPVFSGATALSLIHSDRTAHPSAIFRKSCAIDAGLYREGDFPSEDLSLWIRLAKIGELISVPESVLTYTLHPKSISASRYNEAKYRSRELIDSLFILDDFVGTIEKDFNFYLKSYQKMRSSNERKFLFLRDLLVPRIFTELSIQFRAKVIAYLLFQLFKPAFSMSVFRLFIARRRRAKTRLA